MAWIFLITILIFSAILHEVAHAAMASHLGDQTAKHAGRLTLNPIKHLDPIGSFLLPLLLILFSSPFIFAWAKPVPVNPYNFRDQKYGNLKVSAAGPAINFILVIFFGFLLRFVPFFSENPQIFFIFGSIVFINLVLGFFNLIPIPPLDGSHIFFTFFPVLGQKIKVIFSQYGFFIILGILLLFGTIIINLLFFFIVILFELISGISFSVFNQTLGMFIG